MKNESRVLQVASLLMLAFALLVLPPTSVDAWETTCDNCYVGFNQYDEPDAQCCLDGYCDFFNLDESYVRIKSNMEWCTSWVSEESAGCNGEANTCTADEGEGGGGGGGSCNVQYGHLCPAECFQCTYFYY